MVAPIFKTNQIFADIFDDIKHHFTDISQAYRYAEKVFATRCLEAFGVYAQAYESFISFYNAYAYAKGEPPRL